ncbi:MAG: flagellar export protein FliJ [Burkholderiales bacterium]|jgi:flagellar protein FliJ|nr:flagellar export protein FliJ [Burkholderiales bacterium]
MSRRFPLQPLVDLYADRVEAAERRLQALDADRRQAKEKLAQVEAYRVEYRERLQLSLAQGMNVTQVRDYQAFLNRLDEACGQQGAEVAVREAAYLEGQKDWLEQRRRKKAFDALSTRHEQSENARETRLEQRLQDDHAQTMLREAKRDEAER